MEIHARVDATHGLVVMLTDARGRSRMAPCAFLNMKPPQSPGKCDGTNLPAFTHPNIKRNATANHHVHVIEAMTITPRAHKLFIDNFN